MRRTEYYAKPLGWQSIILFVFLVFWGGPGLLVVFAAEDIGATFLGLLFPGIAIIVSAIIILGHKRAYTIENRILYVGQPVLRSEKNLNQYFYTSRKNNRKIYKYTIPCRNIQSIQTNVKKESITSVDYAAKYHASKEPYVKITLKEPLSEKIQWSFGNKEPESLKEIYLSVTNPNKLRMGVERNR